MQLLAAVATFRVQQLRQLGDVGGDAPGVVAGEQLGRRPPAGLVLNINVASATTCAQPLVFGGSVGPTLFLHPNLANQETETLADRRRRQIYREVLSPSFQLRPRGLTLGPPAKERISRPDRL